MSVMEAKAHIEITADALGDIIRRRLTEGSIGIDSIPGFDSGDNVKLKCNDLQELNEKLPKLLTAIENEDHEKINEMVEVDNGN